MAEKKTGETETAADRRRADRRTGERRTAAERRTRDDKVAKERRSRERRKPAAQGERRKVERRINEYPLKPEVLEFINAVNEFKSVQQKPFPTWTEIFEIFTSLGYRKVETD